MGERTTSCHPGSPRLSSDSRSWGSLGFSPKTSWRGENPPRCQNLFLWATSSDTSSSSSSSVAGRAEPDSISALS
eukprot:5896858-Pyramimonas_sp.AAC.1